MTRRTVLRLIPPAALAATTPAEPLGRIKPRDSKSIAASPLAIGFETLDRGMFDPDRTYAHLAKLGVKWARCQTGWARTEKSKGVFDFAWLDSVVDNLLRIGIQPWFNLGYGNRLYTPGPPHESAVGWAPLNSGEARQAWLRYVSRIAERYARRVKHWEIWNEPNIKNFWQPDNPDPARYVELVKMTAPVIRKRIPGCTLIGGAFAGMTAYDYFEGCFQAGLGNYVEKISYHPYRAQPEWKYREDVRALRGIIKRFKPSIAIWQGENGAPSAPGGAGALANLEWNETRQAKWLLRRILIDLLLDIEFTSYFQTVDMVNYVWSTGQSGKTNFKGVLRGTDYTPKPSYYAYQNLCALFDGETKHSDFLVRFDRGLSPLDELRIEAGSFARRGGAMYVYWLPTDLMTEHRPWPVRMTAWSGGGARLDNPVLVDLLSGDITKPPKAARTGGTWVFDGLPVRDYPMMIAEGSLVL